MSKRGVKKRLWLLLMIILVYGSCSNWVQLSGATCVPRGGCSRALAAYEVVQGDTLDVLVGRFQTTIEDLGQYNDIPEPNSIPSGTRILFPFPCRCQGSSLGYNFLYEVKALDTVSKIAKTLYERLTRETWIAQATSLPDPDLIFPGITLQVPVNCSCGKPDVSLDYGLFTTYPARSSDNASSLATSFRVSEDLLRRFNPSTNWNGFLSDQDIIFIPAKDAVTGLYPPYNASDDGNGGKSSAVIVGVSVGGGVALLLLLVLLFCLFCFCNSRKRSPKEEGQTGVEVGNIEAGRGHSWERRSVRKGSTGSLAHGISNTGSRHSALSEFTVDKSVEFSFEELAAATNNFNIANKIGEGGYGAVYFANLRGQKLAVKRMNLQATREFLAELQVLTHVHHTNLVQLIGYCTVDSLFLIYEYVENGTLDRHLHGSHDLPPLLWPARVQIALDAARGLEYIHEHTKPTYIHRDVKSSNILIDKQLHAKVADFGLTKLTESGIGSCSLTLPTRLVGTFGYMSPEYARYGDVSPKVDVYSFGVVLFEIISAKQAIVRTTGNSSSSSVPHKEEQQGLVTLFENVLRDVDGKERLRSLVDPALGNNYPLESAWKMAQLAGACTQDNPELRPTMRTVVVALMTLSSTTQDWDMSAYGSDTVMSGLISGR